jgi:hypothetical protein
MVELYLHSSMPHSGVMFLILKPCDNFTCITRGGESSAMFVTPLVVVEGEVHTKDMQEG